jgi:multidrug efflux pump subunit AcrB
VNATLQGASAETMAASVAAPLERQFGQIPGVTQLTSMSALNGSSITIQFRSIATSIPQPRTSRRR